MKFSEIEQAFEFVWSAEEFTNSALVSKATGEMYFRSELAGEDDFPEDYEENPDLIEIPHRNELDCGTDLVWRFVDTTIPEDRPRVRGYFSSPGAYGRFKAFLESKGLLDKWYDFEESKTQEALREWCKDEGIELDD